MDQPTGVMEVEELAQRLAAGKDGRQRSDLAQDGKQRLLLLDVRESFELRMCDLRRHLEQTGQLQFQDAHAHAHQLLQPVHAAEPGQEEDEKRKKKWMPRARRGERLEIGYEVVEEEVGTSTSAVPVARRGRDEGFFYFVHIPMGQLGQRLHDLRPFIADEVVVVCHLGQRSHMVTQQLRAIGFDRARNLAGGLAAWTARIDNSLPSYHH